jgi:hypothetical protein
MTQSGNDTARGIHTGVPSYFKGWCLDAARSGSPGYSLVGYQLARAIYHEMPHDIEADDWRDEVDKLIALLDADDDSAVVQWFKSHYPAMMERIPKARHAGFVDGVRRAYDEGLIAD